MERNGEKGAAKKGKSPIRPIADILLVLIAAGAFFALRWSERAARSGGDAMDALPVSAIYRGAGEDCAALICCVDWNASALPEILELLESRGAHMTFAVTEEWCREAPGMLRRIGRGGHELAVLAEGESGARSGIVSAAELIESLTGEKPELVFCAGERECRAAAAAGMKRVVGSLDLVCILGDESDIIARASANTKAGEITVCAPTAAFAAALPALLELYSGMDLTCTTVSGTIYH